MAGLGVDTVDYLVISGSSAGAPVDVDLLRDTQSGGFADGDVLVSIENVGGSIGNDAIRGNAVANTLAGNGGDDFIDGFFGDDLLFGDDGNDTLIGDLDNDQLFGGEGDDTLFGGSNDRLLNEFNGSGEYARWRGWQRYRHLRQFPVQHAGEPRRQRQQRRRVRDWRLQRWPRRR